MLVHGSAVAVIGVDGGEEVEVTANGSGQMLPVNRTFSGGTVTIRLVLGAPGGLDARLRLDGGIVYGSGLAATASTAGAVPPKKAAPPRKAAPPKQAEIAVPEQAGRQPGTDEPSVGPCI